MDAITLALVEDDSMVRSNLWDFFSKHTAIKVWGAFASIEAFLSAHSASTEAPRIILLDIGLPGMSALEGLPYIRTHYPKSEIIMLTSNENPETIFQSIQAGAVAYLSKKSSLESIANAIETVLRGESFMTPIIARIVFSHLQNKHKSKPVETLTQRQMEIIRGLKDGLSYKMIADQLQISIETVRDHIKTIYRKLQVNSRNEVVRKYIDGELDKNNLP